jgi:predicted acylesterase/phospholipase RssA
MLAVAAASAANVAAIQALQAGSLGFGLSGGGFVVYYLVGVVDALIALGIIIPGQSKIAGASAGALASTAVCAGLNGQQLRQQAFSLADLCQVPGNCGGVLDAKVKQLLNGFVVNDAYVKCNNTGYLSITTGDITSPRNLLVGTYTSNADLK